MNTVSSDVRDGHTHNARETLRVTDVKILQKVNAVNREAFAIRFPGLVEHHMRLVSERLQACLVKPPGIDLGQPSTWPAGSERHADAKRAKGRPRWGLCGPHDWPPS